MSAKRRDPVLVIGLGRFGGSVAQSLMRMGHEVLGVDNDPASVQSMADELTQTVEADSTDVETLKSLGAADFTSAVVGIGTDIEASVLTVLGLADLGVPSIWAKATNENHGRILQRTGAHHIVFPEARMGETVAHLLNGQLLDFIQFDDKFAIAKLDAPSSIVGQTLEMSEVRKKYDVTVIGIKRLEKDFEYAVPDTWVLPDDTLIVSGRIEDIERFASIG
ncbi:MAG TPA: TrkA family potassium uptake protein [Alteraurantiacibacter sp.]